MRSQSGEKVRAARIEEDMPRQIGRRFGIHRRVQGLGAGVAADDIHPVIANEDRHLRHGVGDLLQAGRHVSAGTMPWRATGRVDLAHEVEKVAAFDRAEPQRVHERGEDDIGCPAHMSALQLGVVVETHGRQIGDLLPTQAGHPTEAAEVGRPTSPGARRARQETKNSVTSCWACARLTPKKLVREGGAWSPPHSAFFESPCRSMVDECPQHSTEEMWP
ncbi:hypothetical protein GCM10028781_05170 [Nostocoides australiense]